MTENNKEVIDLRDVVLKIWRKRRLFYWVWLATFILSCLYILPVPRTYNASVSVAPESTNTMQGNSLTSIANSLGFDMGGAQTTDAFYPGIYPEVMASNEFILNMMKVKVKTADGRVQTDYYHYLLSHRKYAFYKIPMKWVRRTIKKLTEGSKAKNQGAEGNGNEMNTFYMSEIQSGLFGLARKSITCDVDKKTGIININVTDQDPLVCALIADSARLHLQDYITRYRTSKARIDYEYYLKLTNEAHEDYVQAMRQYDIYCDSHLNTTLQAERSKREKLENDLNMKLNTYNSMNTHLVAAKAKIQECTPVFSLLQGPSVPNKPSKPKRMIFVAGMLFFASCGTVLYIFRNGIKHVLLGAPKDIS